MGPDDLIAAARSYLGVSWEHCGRSHEGVDCVGLILAAARDCGLLDLEYSGYSRHVQPAVLRAQIERFCDPVTPARPGDVLLFSILGQAQHVGLATEKGVIHAYESAGAVVEHRLDGKWRRRLVSVYRWKGW